MPTVGEVIEHVDEAIGERFAPMGLGMAPLQREGFPYFPSTISAKQLTEYRDLLIKVPANIEWHNDRRAIKILAMIWDACQSGTACPTNAEIRDEVGTVPFPLTPAELARKGYFTVEVYGKNWRIIEMNGKRTSRGPYKITTPHLVIDQKGTRRGDAIEI